MVIELDSTLISNPRPLRRGFLHAAAAEEQEDEDEEDRKSVEIKNPQRGHLGFVFGRRT